MTVPGLVELFFKPRPLAGHFFKLRLHGPDTWISSVIERKEEPESAPAGRQRFWNRVYEERGETNVSWFQDTPKPSLELLEIIGARPDWSVIDVGGGASRLVDCLYNLGFRDLSVLDLSEHALQSSRERLGEASRQISWIVGDATQWEPDRQFDLWHDRAAFHFLVNASDQDAYLLRLKRGLRPGGFFIVATFALDGPEKCSGLPIVRYNVERLSERLGPDFVVVRHQSHSHRTPWGAEQKFQYSVLRFAPRS